MGYQAGSQYGKNIEMFPDAVKTYDVPVYSGENPAVLDVD